MKYQVKKISNNLCSIRVVAESDVEKKLLNEPDKYSKEDYDNTFLFHYTDAVEEHIHPSAVVLEVDTRSKSYPKDVIVKFEIVI